MKLSKSIEYFAVCKLSDGYSPNTIELYTWALERFSSFGENPEVSEISLEQLRRFMLYMKNDYKPNRPGGSTAPLSAASLENIWIALRSFFSWAEIELEIPRPDERLARPPNPPPAEAGDASKEIVFEIARGVRWGYRPSVLHRYLDFENTSDWDRLNRSKII